MDLREKLKENSTIVGGVCGFILLIAGLVTYRATLGQPHANVRMMNSAFFSDDDGKTWFIDDASKVPPFEHRGGAACRAEVYRYGNGKKFVAYLEKFSDQQKPEIEAQIAGDPQQATHWLQTPMLVKKPGDPAWLPPGGDADARKAYEKAIEPISPDGSTNMSPVAPSDPDAGR